MVEEWLPILGLDDWSISVDYHAIYHETNRGVLGQCNYQDEYQTATVDLYLPGIIGTSPRYQEYVIVHELCHCLVGPIYTKTTRRRDLEIVVTTLAKCFLRTKYGPDSKISA